jgi:hypothetical protein
MIIVILLIIFIVFVILYLFVKKTPVPSNKKDDQIEIPKYRKTCWCKEDCNCPISCGCYELQTSHPGRVQHKLRCPIFRKLNPNLTIQQFLKFEGFPSDQYENWPELND